MRFRHGLSILLFTTASMFQSAHVAHASHHHRSRPPEYRAAPVAAVSDPYHDGYVLALWHTQYADAELDRIFERLKKAGTRHVEVVMIGCQTDIHSSDVGDCETRPYAGEMRVMDRALANGMELSILPLIGTLDGKWRGYFDPTDVDGWFNSYGNWIKKVAADSERRHLTELVIGSELSIIQKYDSRWRKLIAEIRQIYHGALVFTANWDALDTVSFWDAVDAIGVSAYFRLSGAPAPTQDELNRAWASKKAILMSLQKRWNRPIHVTEVGYTNASSAADTPYYTPPEATRDDALQAKCFEAFRASWKDEKQLVRANIWANSGFEMDEVEISGDPVGHPAEDVIRAMIDERAGLAQ